MANRKTTVFHKMIRKAGNTMGTLIVGLILAGIISLIIATMVRDKKAGKSLQCGCDCKHCSGNCRHD